MSGSPPEIVAPRIAYRSSSDDADAPPIASIIACGGAFASVVSIALLGRSIGRAMRLGVASACPLPMRLTYPLTSSVVPWWASIDVDACAAWVGTASAFAWTVGTVCWLVGASRAARPAVAAAGVAMTALAIVVACREPIRLGRSGTSHFDLLSLAWQARGPLARMALESAFGGFSACVAFGALRSAGQVRRALGAMLFASGLLHLWLPIAAGNGPGILLRAIGDAVMLGGLGTGRGRVAVVSAVSSFPGVAYVVLADGTVMATCVAAGLAALRGSTRWRAWTMLAGIGLVASAAVPVAHFVFVAIVERELFRPTRYGSPFGTIGLALPSLTALLFGVLTTAIAWRTDQASPRRVDGRS